MSTVVRQPQSAFPEPYIKEVVKGGTNSLRTNVLQ